MLDAEEVRTFVQGTVHFFETATGHPATVGSPYLCIDKSAVVQDYAGVYFTAPRGMLSVMLMCMNETDTGEQNVRDLVGEVANTISGNARRDFGRNFVISTPTICDRNNAATAAATTGRSFVIPINWRSYAANVVVCLQ
jgi:chemotaxis protein CheX